MIEITDEEIREFAEDFIGNGEEGIVEAFENAHPTIRFTDLSLSQLEQIDLIVQVCAGCGFGKEADYIQDLDGELYCEDCIEDYNY